MSLPDSRVTGVLRAGRVTLTGRLVLSLTLAVCARGQAHQIRSDWLTQDNEYVMAFVNLTYHDPNSGELHYHSGEIGKYSDGLVAVAAGRLLHVHARNGTVHDGCDWPWETPSPQEEAWIALVRHGRCSADLKLENAYRANASALVVYDDQPRGVLQQLHLSSQHRDSLVAVFFRKEQGEELVALVERGLQIWMQLNPGRRITFSVEKLNRTSVLFVSMSFILLLVISLAWLLFYYVQRFRYMHAKDRLARHLVSAARKALSRVPLRTLKVDDEQLGEAECCAVCLETYRASECVRMLPCSHQFHMVCVDPWLLKNRSCPMCKMDILKYYGMTVGAGEEGLPQVGSPVRPSSPEPVPITLPSSGSSPQHAGRRTSASSSPRSLVQIAGSQTAGREQGGTCTAPDNSTCRVIDGSTCTTIGGSTCAAGVADECDVQMALRRPDLPVSSVTAGTASYPALAGGPATIGSSLHSTFSPAERRLSLPDDDSSLSESGGTFQSCHPASCGSLSSGSPDVSSVADLPVADPVVVVHMNDQSEMDTNRAGNV